MLCIGEENMKKHIISWLLACVMICGVSLSFTTILPDDIIVADPISETLFSTAPVYMNVNVNNVEIKESPVYVTLVKMNNNITFSSELGETLNVPLLKLVSPKSYCVVGNPTLVEPAVYSESYQVETEIINSYFETKKLISSLKNEQRVMEKMYQFDDYLEKNKMSEVTQQAFEKYEANKDLLSLLNEQMKELTSVYVGYFETLLFHDQISSMSYYYLLGELEPGQYALRFLDHEHVVIKELHYTVLEDYKELKLIK